MTDIRQQDQFLDVLVRNTGIILKISRAYTKTDQDKEDLVNDITLQLWKSFEKFKGDSKISTWIYRVALNTSMNFKRRNENNRFFPMEDVKKIDDQNWLIGQCDSSYSEILYECIDELNELNKAIILLYLDGNSHEEISEITGISKTNVGTRIGRIKEELRSMAITKI
jgi:RNA polymerase sigma-70 factor, ECF subfamily